MSQRTIKKKKYSILQRELDYITDSGVITKEQKQDIEELYDVKNNFNFIQVLLSIGALLLGIGILTFVASNWRYLGTYFKFGTITGLVGLFNYGGYSLRHKYPKTSKSLIYTGALTYGAGIFLIAQMFNFRLEMPSLFLIWFIGVIPLAIYTKDTILLAISQILLIIYMNSAYVEHGVISLALPIAILIYFIILNRKKLEKVTVEIMNIITGLNISFIIVEMINTNKIFMIFISYFILGIVLVTLHYEKYSQVYTTIGRLIYSITGVILTMDWVWEYSKFDPIEKTYNYIYLGDMAIPFAIVFMIYLLCQIRKGSMFNIILLCVMILRYYVDISYDFLPKSLFFIVGGLILMGFGVYFERQRKHKVLVKDVGTEKGGENVHE